MTTLTASTPFRLEYCCHKLPTSCRLTARPICCACQDRRPHASSYRKYIDGVGFVMLGTRQDNYCWPCKVFWDERVACSGVIQADTRIPDLPGIALFINTWHDWQRGFRIIQLDNQTQERQELRGEPLESVEIGHLPRPSPGISLYDRRSTPWVLENDANFEVPSNIASSEEVYIPDEDRLFDSDSDDSRESLELAIPATGNRDNGFVSMDFLHLTAPQLIELRNILQRLRSQNVGLERLSSRIEPFVQQLSRDSEGDSGIEELRGHTRDLHDCLEGLTVKIADALRLQQSPGATAREAERRRYVRLFGTAEDVQQPDYVSPLSNMFGRHWERFHAAEEQRHQASRRETGRSLNQPENNQDTRPAMATAADLRRIEDTLRASARVVGLEDPFSTTQGVINSIRTSRQNAGSRNRVQPSIGPLKSLLPPPNGGLQEDQMYIKLQCTVCLEQIADIALVPCGEYIWAQSLALAKLINMIGHLVMCRWCSEKHSRIDTYNSPEERRLANQCPLCRAPIKQRVFSPPNILRNQVCTDRGFIAAHLWLGWRRRKESNSTHF